MNAEEMLFFVRYHVRANERILEETAKLSDDEFRRPAQLDHGTAFQTLRHLVDVDWSWREFCTGHDVGETYVWDSVASLDDLPSIQSFAAEEHGRLLNYVGSMDEPELDELLMLDPESDPPERVPRWHVLAHVVNHGTQHRSEMARYLTDCGHSPGDLDLL
jgi:uncharacterized damage-inducible protein DinB